MGRKRRTPRYASTDEADAALAQDIRKLLTHPDPDIARFAAEMLGMIDILPASEVPPQERGENLTNGTDQSVS